jgi:hypothetical protein
MATDTDSAKPDWTNRRRVIFCALRHDLGAFWALLIGAFALAVADKFDGWIATFTLCAMFTVAAHSVLIIGSYVFQASWEGAKFMDFLASIKPSVAGPGPGIAGKEPA